MEFTAKSVKDAISLGLEALGITEDNAEITVKKEAVKGLFGKIKENAVVEIVEKKKIEEKKSEEKKNVSSKPEKKQAKTEEPIDSKQVLDFTNELLNLLDIKAETQYSDTDENPVVTLISDESSKLIGFRGEILDAIQTLVSAKANIGKTDYQKIVVDCENYRSRREDTLIALAKKLETKATEMKREVMLEPMSAFERRIIHTALANSTTCTTRSDGKEPARYVVIVPNELDEFSKPYNAGKKFDDGYGKKDNNKRFNHGRRNDKHKHVNNFGEQKKKTSISFGTYLGNSLKDDN